MTTSALASDHAAVIRDRLKDYVHEGAGSGRDDACPTVPSVLGSYRRLRHRVLHLGVTLLPW